MWEATSPEIQRVAVKRTQKYCALAASLWILLTLIPRIFKIILRRKNGARTQGGLKVEPWFF